MKNAKQTADAYEQTRDELKDYLQPLFDEKNEKRKALRKAFDAPEEQKDRRKLERVKRQRLNDEFKEANKTLIQQYKASLRANKENEKVFSEIFAAAQKLNPEVKEEDVRTLIMGKKESQEIMKPQRLQRENHKIDKDRSFVGKLKQGWKEEKNFLANINGIEKKVSIIKKEIEGPNKDAFVWEYTDDGSGNLPQNMIGEQLFNRNAVLNLGLQNRLPTWEQMQKIKGTNPHNYFLEMNFQKDKQNLFPGYCDPNDKKFYGIGEQANCWLADGNSVDIYEDNMNPNTINPRFCFSVRLLQE